MSGRIASPTYVPEAAGLNPCPPNRGTIKTPNGGIHFHSKHPRPPLKRATYPLACFYAATLSTTSAFQWLVLSPPCTRSYVGHLRSLAITVIRSRAAPRHSTPLRLRRMKLRALLPRKVADTEKFIRVVEHSTKVSHSASPWFWA